MSHRFQINPYLAILRKRLRLVLAVFVIVVILASLISFLGLGSDRAYAATVLLLTRRPISQLTFDSRFQDLSLLLPYKAYNGLIKSAAVERKVIDALGPVLSDSERTPEALGKMATVSQYGDPSLMQLTVLASKEESAVKIANTWADVFEQQISELEGTTGRDPKFLSQQLTQADEEFRLAGENLAKFYQTSPLVTLRTAQASVQNLIDSYVSASNTIEALVADATRLRGRIQASGDAAAPASLSDATGVYLLEIRTADYQTQALGGRAATSGSLQMQIPVAELGGQNLTVGQAMGRLDRLTGSLNDDKPRIEAALSQRLPELTELIQKVTVEENKRDSLTLARDTAKQTYTTLENKADEARIATGVEGKEVKVASYAQSAVPKSSPPKALIIPVAAVLGLVLGITAAFAAEYLSLVRRALEHQLLAEPSD
ncbi:MAG: hypothetical protein M1358_14240 [Chloroflexi bacterium]|nr:hypothetical protein [Chloroflexota bacterium]